MDDLKEMTAVVALNSMMDKGYFDICTIDKVAKLLNVPVAKSESYLLLSTLHCVDFGKMPPALRESIPSMIQECLGIKPTYQFKSAKIGQVIELVPPTAEPKQNSFLRLFNKK